MITVQLIADIRILELLFSEEMSRFKKLAVSAPKNAHSVLMHSKSILMELNILKQELQRGS